MKHDTDSCVFCGIVAGTVPASIVWQDSLSIAFVDLRQYHPGHVLIIPRTHYNDLRDADPASASAVMLTTARIMRVVGRLFENDGLSVWHSAGEGANQEVPHLHFHVHPRRVGDRLLDIYPQSPDYPERAQLEEMAVRIRQALNEN